MAKTVLVVEDESDLLELLSARLSTLGYKAIGAKEGKEAIDRVKDSNPDLILLDILIPKISGYEVCRLLKFDERYKSIPVIMVTARTQAVDKDMGKKVGADDYITKPFDNEELMAKIKFFLEERSVT